ncbi:hypothetical protein D3C83_235070 [compost metagenome]
MLAEVGQKDPMTRRIYESYMAFRGLSTHWVDLAERGFLNARYLTLAEAGKGRP